MAAKDVSASWYAPNQQAVGQPGPAAVPVAKSGGKGTVERTSEAPDVSPDADEAKATSAKSTKATKKS